MIRPCTCLEVLDEAFRNPLLASRSVHCCCTQMPKRVRVDEIEHKAWMNSLLRSHDVQFRRAKTDTVVEPRDPSALAVLETWCDLRHDHIVVPEVRVPLPHFLYCTRFIQCQIAVVTLLRVGGV